MRLKKLIVVVVNENQKAKAYAKEFENNWHLSKYDNTVSGNVELR